MNNLHQQSESTLMPNSSIPKQGSSEKLHELEQQLNNGLTKWRIEDLIVLEERIKECEEKTDREVKYLQELRELQSCNKNKPSKICL